MALRDPVLRARRAAHHLVVVERKHLTRLERRKLELYDAEEFAEFRRWASAERD